MLDHADLTPTGLPVRAREVDFVQAKVPQGRSVDDRCRHMREHHIRPGELVSQSAQQKVSSLASSSLPCLGQGVGPVADPDDVARSARSSQVAVRTSSHQDVPAQDDAVGVGQKSQVVHTRTMQGAAANDVGIKFA